VRANFGNFEHVSEWLEAEFFVKSQRAGPAVAPKKARPVLFHVIDSIAQQCGSHSGPLRVTNSRHAPEPDRRSYRI
jgi:hypothetical protein